MHSCGQLPQLPVFGLEGKWHEQVLGSILKDTPAFGGEFNS
jgi:hypothetical protein